MANDSTRRRANRWWLYPTIAAVAAVSALLTGMPTVLASWVYYGALMVAIVPVDLRQLRVPDDIVLPAYPTTFCLLLLASLDEEGAGVRAFVLALLGGAVSFAFYLVLAAATGAMGMGDVKLGGVVGMFAGFLGWHTLAGAIIAAFVLAAAHGLALMATRHATRTSPLPFAPAMLLGGALAALLATLAT